MTNVSNNQKTYFSNVAISCSQIFLGIAAVNFFSFSFDFIKIFMILSNIALTVSFICIGYKQQS